MNTLDSRLYNYEYRRPRPRNPTYNSKHVFDSINMFTRGDQLPQYYGRYSLTKQVKEENLPSIRSRVMKPSGNFSTILPALDVPKKPSLMSGKDSLYLEMLAEINRSKSSRKNESSMRKSLFGWLEQKIREEIAKMIDDKYYKDQYLKAVQKQ